MGTKISPATKQMAIERLRQGLTAKQVSDLTGVSVRSAERLRAQLKQKTAVPARSATAANTPNVPPPPTTEDRQDETTILDFVESPSPIEKQSIVDSAFDSLKSMLGISGSDDQPAPPPVFSAKLNEKQQRFVDATTPMLALGFMSLAAFLWGRIGSEYSILAPNDVVARQIIEPLLRVYARHAQFVQEINPDMADVGASILALVGYVNVSLSLYQEIKQDKEEYEQGYSNNRRYRPASAPTTESRTSNQGGGYADIQRSSNGHAESNGGNVRDDKRVNRDDLTDKEAKQYAALSRLATLDYQHRARRSMRSN